MLLLPKFARGAHPHPFLQITLSSSHHVHVVHQTISHWVIELVDRNGSPGTAEDNVRHDDLVFERCTEGTCRTGTLVLDLATNSRHSLNLYAFKSCNLNRGVEHVSDEGSVLKDLEGVAICEEEL